MLVLSRRVGETVLITLTNGAKVTVTVTEIDRGRVRLQIGAPKEVKILRSELVTGDRQ